MNIKSPPSLYINRTSAPVLLKFEKIAKSSRAKHGLAVDGDLLHVGAVDGRAGDVRAVDAGRWCHDTDNLRLMIVMTDLMVRTTTSPANAGDIKGNIRYGSASISAITSLIVSLPSVPSMLVGGVMVLLPNHTHTHQSWHQHNAMVIWDTRIARICKSQS